MVTPMTCVWSRINTNRTFTSESWPRWTVAWRVVFKNMPQMAAFTSRTSIGSAGSRVWSFVAEDMCRLCGQSCLSALEFPEFLIRWMLQISLYLFCKQQISPLLPLHDNSKFYIRKDRQYQILLLSRQVSPLLCPSARQSMHLATSLENSTLRPISNFFSSCIQISLQLWVSPGF